MNFSDHLLPAPCTSGIPRTRQSFHDTSLFVFGFRAKADQGDLTTSFRCQLPCTIPISKSSVQTNPFSCQPRALAKSVEKGTAEVQEAEVQDCKQSFYHGTQQCSRFKPCEQDRLNAPKLSVAPVHCHQYFRECLFYPMSTL